MKTILTTSLTLALAAAGVLAFGIASGDGDGDDDEHRRASAASADPRHTLYLEECGSCHFAYPAALLPADSWSALMGALGDHFGDDATLPEETGAMLGAYLADHAARPGGDDHGERTWRATRGLAPPLRITETDYFRGQHHEIPERLVADNPDVGSFSRCTACHQAADRGDFDDDRVRIPGYGRWDD